MRVVSDLADLESAWTSEYARLARAIAALLPSEVTALVEVGCGRGQLTVSLVRNVAKAQGDVIDRFAGPYSSDREQLFERLKSAGLVDRVRVLSGDATKVLRRQPTGSLDAIVSGEFLSELTSSSLASFFESCHRSLRGGGVSVHAYLSPAPRNEGQRLTIEADSDPRWTNHPPAEWFSPSLETARRSITKTGFADVRVEVKRSRLRFTGLAAAAQLEGWGVRAGFYRNYEGALRKHGLELPDWVVLRGIRRQ